VVTITATLVITLSSLEGFGNKMVVVVGLVQNMFWTSIFLGQSGAQCPKLKHIIHGNLNGTLAGWKGCVITSTINSTTLLGITGFGSKYGWGTRKDYLISYSLDPFT
jgi:hypothetical protein